MRVDVHAHYFPVDFMNLFGRLAGTACIDHIPRAVWTDKEQREIGLRLGMMDDAGVAIQVLSVASMFPYFASEADAVNTAQVCNDTYAELVACYPQRLIKDHLLTWPIGAPFEDTSFALLLIQRKIPSRYPKIRFIVPHLGGMLPLILERLDAHAHIFMPPDSERPSVTLSRLWYDTVGHGSIAALRCACAEFGAEHLVLGSDYPYQLHEQYKRAVTYVQDALSKDDADRILDHNAAELLNLAETKK